MIKIFLDPGHGGKDPGAVANGLLEKELTLTIAMLTEKHLTRNYKDVDVKLSRVDDYYMSLDDRTDMANDWGADYLCSIHVNAGGGDGFESYIYNGEYPTKNTTDTMRDMLHHEIVRATGFNDRGEKQANFHMVRESAMHAALTENGFIDYGPNARRLTDPAFLNRIATGHAKGIAKIFDLEPKTTDNKYWRVQTGAFKYKSNAEDKAQQLKEDGYDTYIVKY